MRALVIAQKLALRYLALLRHCFVLEFGYAEVVVVVGKVVVVVVVLVDHIYWS